MFIYLRLTPNIPPSLNVRIRHEIYHLDFPRVYILRKVQTEASLCIKLMTDDNKSKDQKEKISIERNEFRVA